MCRNLATDRRLHPACSSSGFWFGAVVGHHKPSDQGPSWAQPARSLGRLDSRRT